MTNHRFRTRMLVLGAVMLASTGGLVALNGLNPGLCPPYPLIGLPACVVMLSYFAVMFGSLFVSSPGLARRLFYIPGSIALVTGIGFSIKELVLAGAQCPQVFGVPVPLCFTAPPMVGLMLYWAWAGDRNDASESRDS